MSRKPQHATPPARLIPALWVIPPGPWSCATGQPVRIPAAGEEGRSFLGRWHLFTRHWPETNSPVRNHSALQGALVHVLNFCPVQSPEVKHWLDPHLWSFDLRFPRPLPSCEQPDVASSCSASGDAGGCTNKAFRDVGTSCPPRLQRGDSLPLWSPLAPR